MMNEQEKFWAQDYAQDYIDKNNCFDQALALEAWNTMLSKSEGIEFPPNVVEEKLSGAVDEAEDFKSSLQYDLTVGKPLELDDLLGSVVLMARSAGIPVPASATLTMVLDKFKNGS